MPRLPKKRPPNHQHPSKSQHNTDFGEAKQRLVIGVDENAPGKISQAMHGEVQVTPDWK